MKLKNILYTLLVASTMLLAACTPDSFSFGDKTYSAEDLVAPDAYTVTINGNKVTLESKVSGCTPLWVTPNGRSQEQSLTIELPFAGDYEVTFGVETPGGVVYGNPYQFNLAQNDFSLLSDEKWFLLADKDYKTGDELPDAATLSAGIKKRWYPCDGDYGIGRCTGPVMYITPYDPDGDGVYDAADEANVTYKDIVFGSANWKPNWDPGFQSWLIPETDPYMDSYMEFSMDAKNGCVATMYRGESGTKGSSTGTNMVGKFNLNLTDKTKPLATFTDCYSMHNTGFDEVCSNYTTDIQIIELTPYLLQIATKRTNSEGNWYICWNFVSEDVIKTKGECIPKEESGLLEKVDPVLPTFNNIMTDLFTAEIGGNTYVGSTTTFKLDTEKPYDFWWWNASADVQKWQPIIDGKYNSTWAPAAGDDIEDFEMTINKASDGTLNYECGDVSGKVTIVNGVMTFDKDISILTTSSDNRTIAVKGKVFTILENTAAETLTIGVPESTDENGYVNSYLVANLTYKKISTGGETGPTKVSIDSSTIPEHMWIENGALRLAFWSYGDSGSGILTDVGSVKLKKNQTISVTFKISGVTWSQTPKCALIDNNIKTTWEQGCYDLDDAVTVNVDGETTVSLYNNTGSTQTFKSTCLDLSIQMDGYGTLEDGTAVTSDNANQIKLEIVSVTIQ